VILRLRDERCEAWCNNVLEMMPSLQGHIGFHQLAKVEQPQAVRLENELKWQSRGRDDPLQPWPHCIPCVPVDTSVDRPTSWLLSRVFRKAEAMVLCGQFLEEFKDQIKTWVWVS
jgi:hypothetical protein